MKNIKNNKSLNYINIAGRYVIFFLLIFSCSQEKIFNIIPNKSQLLNVEFQVREKIIALSDSLSKKLLIRPSFFNMISLSLKNALFIL